MVQTESEKNNRDKVRWACRRGMLELDEILIPFFEESYDSLHPDKKDLFEKLLEADDRELHSWFLKGELPDNSNLQDLVMIIGFLAKKRVKQGETTV